ncbi:thioesterase-like superfamily-domain-containing protein [Microdochium trichocladiopsis]|uniref:Thioesterase-like superfamily-domain-containing protein n=1 Tax=Microdochium trichocladiopsis TaxID=1682393 RepID=A0A9P8Y0W3_9PEZI|nr:thioesterase-like superfamily-domain-containing protein [Microdochium trichocladiopsis]KAH7026717.1 thioesterase-like superfamily-domain-containing protein [Microdochium trichocladiopsis]
MAFQRSVEATPLSSHTYSVSLDAEWCIGSVPNGGYVTSTIISAVNKHFATTLARLGQPDTMSMQLQFLRRTHAGAGVVTVADVKLGSGISVVHATLSQDGRDEVQGYVTHMNFSKEAGLSIPTEPHCGLLPAPKPIDFSAIDASGRDAHWHTQREAAITKFRKGMQHLVFVKPNVVQDAGFAGFADQWVRFRPGGQGSPTVPFVQEAIGYVVDMFPLAFRESPHMSQEEKMAPRWYPTVLLNLDIKRRIPDGTEWLYVRATTVEVHNGRFDIQVVVLDQAGSLIALSNHVTLVLGAERNLAARKKPSEAGKL